MSTELPEEMQNRSMTFDRVAKAYDRFRPGYPDALVEQIITTAHLPPEATILDVGCGTGKASLPFARRGYTIHCLDTGQNLIDVARQKLAFTPKISFEVADFNDWQGPLSFYDLIIAGQAWHWMDPAKSYAKAAKVLRPNGSLAVFWNMSIIPDTPVFQAIQSVYQEIVPDLKGRSSYNEEEIAQTIAEIEKSGYFQDVRVWRFPWSQRYTEEGYLGLLNTFSDHILLPAANRQRLHTGIAQAIRRHGGYVDRPVVAVVFIGQKGRT